MLLALIAFFDEVPNDVALHRVYFSCYDLVAQDLTSSDEVDPATDLDQFLSRNCLL